MINKIIEKSIEIGIPITCEYVLNRGFVYTSTGFYKSDTITLEEDEDGNLIATARYNEKTEIKEPEDIVKLNYNWWEGSKYRFEGWKQPGTEWSKLFDMFNLKY